MLYTTYVLQDASGNLYKGVTSDIQRRLAEHKRGKTKTTSRMKELAIAYTRTFDNFEDARKHELYLKSAAGRRFLKKVLHP